MNKDLYEILGLDRNNFSEKELKRNYKKLALKYHPDRQAGKSDEEKKEAEEKFKEISHAYEVLSDPEKKNNYDTFGDENGKIDSDFGFNPFGGFSNPFDAFFGKNHRQGGFRSSSFLQPGDDIRMTIPISIEDLFNGYKKTVKYKKKVRCISCHGKGGTGEKPCPTCHGTGRIVNRQSRGGWMSIEETVCPTCHGKGTYIEHKCSHCDGTGFDIKEVTLDIELPAGIPNNVMIPFEGKGSEASDHRAENGDFVVVTKYNIDNEKYIIEGNNVIEHIDIPYYDILLGCNYTVNIPNGITKTIKIKPCTKENKLIKLKNEGIKSVDGHIGDYYVCVHYAFPDSLSNKEKEHMEMIKKLNNN